MKKTVLLVCLLAALSGPVQAFGEITMFASPDGDGRFIIEGDNAQGVTSIELTIGYDAAALSNPRAEAQGGSVADIREDAPGELTIRVNRENPDAAFELHLQFDKKGDLPGVIQYVSASARDKEGRNYLASSDLRALSPPPANPPVP